MNEELRRRIEARRDEELATIASVAAGAFGSSAAKRQYRAKHKATADALSWVLDLLDAQPAAVSLPEEAEPPAICGWRLTEWDRCTRPADHEGACA